MKADPFAFAAEVPPQTNSVIHRSQHEWSDDGWLQVRRDAGGSLDQAVSIYEVHLGSWRRDPADPDRELDYEQLADELADYCVDMGFTHVELLPVMAHPFSGSWGYQVTSYFAPTPRHGDPDGFKRFVDRLHGAGVGVLLDWVPAHFPRDDWALARFDGTALYEHADPRQGAHPDWGTLVFNFGRNEVRNFLVANALWWLREYHADGLRVDAVASMLYLDYSREEGEWVPNRFGGRENLEAVDFLKEFNEVAHAAEPGVISAAEESTAWPGVSRPTYLGGLGFGFKWNMGWMHDTLAYFQQEPVYRKYHHHELTFSLVYAFSENFILPLSHDEVVHGKGSLIDKMPGDRWQKFANLRCLYAFMWAHPGKQLLFMGQEFAQGQEWSHERSLDWHLLEQPTTTGSSRSCRDLNGAYKAQPVVVGARLSTRPASGGSRPTTRAPTSSPSPAPPRTPRRSSCASRTCLPCRARGTASGCRAPAAGRRRSTRTPSTTAARTPGTGARSRRSRSRGTTSRSPPRSRSRRSPCSGSCPSDVVRGSVPATTGGSIRTRRGAVSAVGQPEPSRLLIACPDRPGIVAAVAGFLHARGANIVASDQHSTDPRGGTLFMRMAFVGDDDGLGAAFGREVAEPFAMEWTLWPGARRKRMAILVSREDHCLLDLLWRRRRGELEADVPVVISNHADHAADVAAFGIPYEQVPVPRGAKPAAEARMLELLAGGSTWSCWPATCRS
jgi:alpha-1,4-glucan:alpha-1,4-glucan 6-glycosyltransferase